MKEQEKKSIQLEAEIARLRQRVAELERAEAGRQQAEAEREVVFEALRRSQERYRGLVGSSGSMVFIVDRDGVFLEAGGTRLGEFNLTPKDVVGRSLTDLFPEHEARGYRARHLAVFNSGEPVTYEQKFTFAGITAWDLVTVYPIRDESGAIESVGVICRDITARKEMEEALRDSELLLDATQHLSKVGGWQWDVEAQKMRWTAETYRIHDFDPGGLSPGSSEHIEKSAACYDAKDRAAILAAFERCATYGEPYDLEVPFTSSTGRRLWVRTMARAEWDGNRIVQVIGNIMDITDRKATEEAVLREKLLSDAIVENMPAGIAFLDCDFVLRKFNRVYADLIQTYTPYTPEQALGLSYFDYVPGSRDQVEEWFVGVKDTGRVDTRTDFTLVLKDGDGERVTHWDTSVAPVLDPGGQVKGILILTQDVTERKRSEAERARLQEQLAQAQKMESVGRLAGGVAHDFNNMLSAIIGHAELAMRQVDSAHPLYADLEEIHQTALHSADLTRQLLAFARKQIVVPRALDLNDTIASMFKMLRRIIGEDIDLVWIPGQDVEPVKIDPAQIDQILANLCVNARDAIPGIGRLTIETRNVTCDEVYCAGQAELVPGRYVLLSVSDTGCGMDQETMSHLFEPYFTTKEPGRGTGLGLSMVYGAVKMNHGFIEVDSEPGQGTTFRIYLPRYEGELPVAAAAPRPNIPGGQEMVLLVEDDASILRLARRVLGRLGYTVLTATMPGQALREAEAHAGDIDLLITDVVMPEMNGRKLADKIRATNPGVKCLYMSGYTADVIAHQGVLDEGVWFLQKPFSIDALAATVREVLDSV